MKRQEVNNNDSTRLDEALQLLRDTHYEGHIDVSDAVMHTIGNTPLLVASQQKRRFVMSRAVAAAACIVLCIGAGYHLLRPHNYDENGINNLLAEVYDYDYTSNGSPIGNEMDLAYLFFE